MLGDEDVEVAGYVRLRLSAEPEARALVLQALEDRGLAVDAAVDLTGSELIVLTGVAPRAVHDRALETLDTYLGRRRSSAPWTGSRRRRP